MTRYTKQITKCGLRDLSIHLLDNFVSHILSNFNIFDAVPVCMDYRQTTNISRTSIGNKIACHSEYVSDITVDPSDAVGASPVGTAPTTSSFLT